MFGSNLSQLVLESKKFEKIIIANCCSSFSSIASRINKFLQNQSMSLLLDISPSSGISTTSSTNTTTTSSRTGLVLCSTNEEFHFAISFFISVSSSSTRKGTNDQVKLGLCELNFGKAQQQICSPLTSNNNSHYNIFQEILSLQLFVDPIFSPTLFEQDERDFFQQVANISISNQKNDAALMNIIFGFSKKQNNGSSSDGSLQQNLQTFFGATKLNIDRKISVWRGFTAVSSLIVSTTTEENREEMLVSRFSEIMKVMTKKKKSTNQQQQQQQLQEVQKHKVMTERKWCLWVSQRLENNKKPELDRASEQDEKDEENRVQTSSRNLSELFFNGKASSQHHHHHFQKLLSETTQVMLEQRRRGRSAATESSSSSSKSPFGRFSQMMFSSSPENLQNNNIKNNNDGTTRLVSIPPGGGVGDDDNKQDNNNNLYSSFDDETEAILKALTEKKKSLTLLKRAEDWFAELSARGVPVPLKQLAMSLPYNWRFWLTPMGFLVIGSCFMMFFGIVLLIV